MKNYYEILGIPEQATGEQIKKAYRKLAKQYHPDVVKDDQEKQKRMYEIQEAYACLGDEQRRMEYDNKRQTQRFSGRNKTTERKTTANNVKNPFEAFFGLQPGKGMESYQRRNTEETQGPINTDEMFTAFFGNLNKRGRK